MEAGPPSRPAVTYIPRPRLLRLAAGVSYPLLSYHIPTWLIRSCPTCPIRSSAPAGSSGVNYAAVLDTAADVARALLHLHKQHVLHSDLKVRSRPRLLDGKSLYLYPKLSYSILSYLVLS